jgi:phosphatidylserine/phosphatidylglycerophosphate/cardiolipin synthase-like enzyme
MRNLLTLLTFISIISFATSARSQVGVGSLEFDMDSEQSLISQKEEMYQDAKFDKRKSLYVVSEKDMKLRNNLFHMAIESIEGISNRVYPLIDKVEVNEEFLSSEFQNNISKKYNNDLTFNNKAKILVNSTSFKMKFEMLARAQKYFAFSSMVMACDPSTNELMDEIIAAAKRGLKVYAIADGAFTFGKTSCKKKLKGIKNIHFIENKQSLNLLHQHFQHEKIWIRDGVEAIVDGSNLIDIETDADGFNDLYRDTGIHIEGPLVTDILSDFNSLWQKYRKKKSLNNPFLASVVKMKELERESGIRKLNLESNLGGKEKACRYIAQGHHLLKKNKKDVAKIYLDHINQAKSYVFMSTQERVISRNMKKKKALQKKIHQRLFELSKEGVHVDYMMNFFRTPFSIKSPNFEGVAPLSVLLKAFDSLTLLKKMRRARRRIMKQVDNDNYKIWSYFQYYHGKTLFIDNIASFTGSFNVNKVSVNDSTENAVICYDKDLSTQYREMIKLDLLNSVPMNITK